MKVYVVLTEKTGEQVNDTYVSMALSVTSRGSLSSLSALNRECANDIELFTRRSSVTFWDKIVERHRDNFGTARCMMLLSSLYH
jgi:hypothetical protein